MNTVLKGSGHSEKISVIDKNEKEDIKQEDIDKQTREDEKVALSDEKILQYRIPRFNEAKIIGKIVKANLSRIKNEIFVVSV